MSRRILRWVAAITITSLVVFSLLPLRPQATLHGTPGHSVLHIAMFGFAALVSLLLTVSQAQRWIGLVGLFALAFAIELGQCIIFHQRMEWTDVRLDSAGTAAAFALVHIGNLLAPRAPFKT